MLLSVLILLVVFVIAMSVAAPRIAASIQRDRDLETMHRGKQYIRAIQLYYRKFNAYPPNIDALVKTNNIRFLRKRYIDPTTGKDDWKPVYFGQNKQPIAFGFFGQPLGGTGGSVIAGTGPNGGNGYPGATTPGGTNTGGDMFSGSSAGSGSSSPTGGMFSNSGTQGATGDTGTTGSTTGTTDANGNPINGQQFGGGGIIGVMPASTKQSILTYKKKNHYNEWEFTYSPLMDQQMMMGGNAGGIGTPASGIGSSGSGIGNSGIGNGPTNGNTGSPPITSPGTPTEPQ